MICRWSLEHGHARPFNFFSNKTEIGFSVTRMIHFGAQSDFLFTHRNLLTM